MRRGCVHTTLQHAPLPPSAAASSRYCGTCRFSHMTLDDDNPPINIGAPAAAAAASSGTAVPASQPQPAGRAHDRGVGFGVLHTPK